MFETASRTGQCVMRIARVLLCQNTFARSTHFIDARVLIARSLARSQAQRCCQAATLSSGSKGKE